MPVRNLEALKYFKDPKTSSLTSFGLIVISLLASVLVLHGFLKADGLVGMCLGTALAMFAMGIGMMMTVEKNGDDKDENDYDMTAMAISGVGHVSAGVMFVLLMMSATYGNNYIKVNDSSTSIRGVGVEDLAEAYKRNPEAYDVVLTNGYVRTEWQAATAEKDPITCRNPNDDFHCTKDWYSAAPIYKDEASASGPPLAWAVLDRPRLTPAQCEGTGLCGFKARSIKAVGEDGLFRQCYGYQCAARESANRGGFTMPAELPSLLMVNPSESVETSKQWYHYYYCFMATFVVSMIVGNINNISAFCSGDVVLEGQALLSESQS